MKITRINNGPKVTLVINSDSKELEPLKRHVLTHFKSSVKIPGFREGSVPPAILEKHVDQQSLADEVVNHAINQFYPRALEVEKIRSLSQPKIVVKKFVPYTELEFEAEIDSLGPITLPDYKKIKVTKQPVTVTAKDINDVMETLRQRLSDRHPTDRVAKVGDEAIIDFDGYDSKGKTLAGASAKRYPLLLGSKSFIPGFEEKLIGTAVGQDIDFKIKFPADYGVAEMAGKNVDFKVKIHAINEVDEPQLDDAFAAKAGPFKNLAELKEDIKKQLKAEREAQAARDYENELVRKITEKSRLEVPQSLVEEEVVRMEEEEKKDLTFRGQTWQEHLKIEDITEEQHRERQRPLAAERIKGGLVLSEIAEKEQITVTNDEVEKHKALLKAQYKDQKMKDEIDKPENHSQIVSRLLTEKTLAKLVGYSSKK